MKLNDSDKIKLHAETIATIADLQLQIDTLTKQHEADLVIIKAWKSQAIAKVNEFESRISALETP